MRLTKLVMKGFRSVKGEEYLVTDDRVTVLIGANDHGKSNLLAAIRCLNNEHSITEDDRNWDLPQDAPVEIQWHFEPTGEALKALKQLEWTQPATTPAATPTEGADPLVATGDAVTTAAKETASDESAKSDAQQKAELGHLYPISVDARVVFSRSLKTNEVKVLSLPIRVPLTPENEKSILALRPRVELFESPSSNVIDQVNQPNLESPQFEFMQGIFRLAGLWDARNTIFAQNDKTSKQLKEASATLTRILNDQWNQGRELKWIFEHTGTNGDSIVIKIEDPAIKDRYTRPSLRSSGFRTYFLLSMIVYARSANTPANSHIYLFDEPGTYLHPAAQLDLQRSFESIADQAQIVYTTHSLFLVSKNYPSRNRVISKTVDGTKIDQKPFSRNWKSVRQSLGILLSNNFLIAEKTLLVEGPSDTVFLLDALKKLKANGSIDVDLNDISIVDAGDSQNYVAMAKIMLSEGRNIVALLDGDAAGKKLQLALQKTCAAEIEGKKLQIHLLPESKSSEDVFCDIGALRSAARAAYEQLIADGSRASKEGVDIATAVNEIASVAGTTLGATLDKVTKTWFNPAEKVSKLFVAIKYEDQGENDGAQPPAIALQELNRIKELLGLRRERSERSGVFEQVGDVS